MINRLVVVVVEVCQSNVMRGQIHNWRINHKVVCLVTPEKKEPCIVDSRLQRMPSIALRT